MLYLALFVSAVLFIITIIMTLLDVVSLKRNPFPKADNGDDRFSDIDKKITRKMYVNIQR